MAEPMTPEQVPAELADIFYRTRPPAMAGADYATEIALIRCKLAAVLPAIRAAALREAAEDADQTPGIGYRFIAGWLRNRADQIKQEDHRG